MARAALFIALLFLVPASAASTWTSSGTTSSGTHDTYEATSTQHYTTSYTQEPRSVVGLGVTVCYEERKYGDHFPYECWGEGIPDAEVTVTAADGTVHTGVTDRGGQVAFEGLSPGTYTVASYPAGFVGDAFEVTTEADYWTRTAIQVKPVDVDVVGELVDEDLQPIAGAHLWFDGYEAWNVTTGPDGAFAGTIPAGRYYIDFNAPGYKRGGASVFIDGDEPIKLMALVHEGGATLTGVVVDPDGTPVPHASVDGWIEPDEQFWGKPYGPETETRDGYIVVSDPFMDPGFYVEADAEGRFTVAVASGYGEASAWAEGYRESYVDFEARQNETNEVRIVLERLPDKDAHVVGTVVDATTGLPVDGFSVDINNQAYGTWSCSRRADEPAPDRWHGRYGRSCDVTTSPGAFEGDVMPGYSTLEVWAYSACEETCRDRYIRHIETVMLEPGVNTFKIELQRRPAADAAVNGYILDSDGEPVQHASVNFHNEETYGWGDAYVDEFGSYRVKLRAGWHQVSVWAPGFYSWQGMVQAVSGKEVPLDIRLTEDPSWQDHGYPYGRPYPRGMPMMAFEEVAYIDDVAYAGGNVTVVTGTASATVSGTASGEVTFAEGFEDESEDGDFVDLGGLGESYDASGRKAQKLASPEDQDIADANSGGGLDIPALPTALLVVALVGLAIRRRW